MKPTYEAAIIMRRAERIGQYVNEHQSGKIYVQQYIMARAWITLAIARLRKIGKWEEAEELRTAWGLRSDLRPELRHQA